LNNPKKYLSYNPEGGAQTFASQPPDPHLKAIFMYIIQVGCCVALHPLGGAVHKQHQF
jgi:hypothetical protein